MMSECCTKERYGQECTRKVVAPVPHLLTALLAKVAIAVIEALVLRLLVQLWQSYARGGRPATAAA
jgi:hypothetical protein